MSLNRNDLSIDDLVLGDLASAGLAPPTGGGGGAAPWYTDARTIASLEGVYDFRGNPDGSTLTLDANSAVSTVEDLGAQGNDATHWRGVGVQVEKALLRTGTLGMQGIYCKGNIDADEKHWGFRAFSAFGAAMSSWHVFAMMTVPSTQTFLGAGSSSAGSIVGGYAMPASVGSSGRPFFACATAGGLATGGYGSIVNGGGGQFSNNNPTPNEGFNLESMVGRGSEITVLLEWRLDGSDNQQFWVNGYKQKELLAGPANDNLDYMFWGKRDANVASQPEQIYGIGISANTHPSGLISEVEAALIRPLMLADFGLSVWDGSTYP